MTYEEYAALPGINATSIKAGAVSMLHMHHAKTGGGKAATPAMLWGSLVTVRSLRSEGAHTRAVFLAEHGNLVFGQVLTEPGDGGGGTVNLQLCCCLAEPAGKHRRGGASRRYPWHDPERASVERTGTVIPERRDMAC